MDGPARRAAPYQPAAGDDYEYRVLTFDRRISGAEARRRLTDHAEYGRWELARVQVFEGGARRVWLRRRIMRVARTG